MNFGRQSGYIIQDTNKTGSVIWSGRMDVDEERRTSCANY